MRYAYKCNEISCKLRNVEVIINKPMDKASEPEYCKECKRELQKIFSSPGVKTGDGYKS